MLFATLSCGIMFSCGSSNSDNTVKNEIQKVTTETGKYGIEWISLPGGTFLMGSAGTEPGRKADEDQHQVTLNSFKISKYEVTVAQFKLFVDATGYVTSAEKVINGFKGSAIWTGSKFEQKAGVNWRYDVTGKLVPDSNYNHPVTHVNWDDAIACAKWMGCRLPTEAEWEFAARAGTTSIFITGNCLGADQANYNAVYSGGKCPKGEYRAKTLRVGSFPANAWGLHDMHGNIAEWCYDSYAPYPTTAQKNPFGPTAGSARVLRGGSWRDNAATCRVAARTPIFHGRVLGFAGFRLVLTK